MVPGVLDQVSQHEDQISATQHVALFGSWAYVSITSTFPPTIPKYENIHISSPSRYGVEVSIGFNVEQSVVEKDQLPSSHVQEALQSHTSSRDIPGGIVPSHLLQSGS